MINHLISILKNRAKTQFIDFLIDILVSSLQEYRRKNQAGEFDVNRGDSGTPKDTADIFNFFQNKKL